MLTSYHNHTRWSDGAADLQGQIEGGLRAGLDELGISDHYVVYPDGRKMDWSLPLDWLDGYVEELRKAAAELETMKLRLGIEADYLPETIEDLAGRLSRHPFDYVIGSVHFVDGFALDADRRPWDELNEDQINAKWRLYWVRIREMAETGVFDFAAHLDLPKKFGHRPTEDFSELEHAALDAIAASNMAIEINTAGWSLSASEAYPSLRLLKEARRRSIPLLINADGHSPAHLTRNFGRAKALAAEAGYTELVRYEQRRRIPYPLTEFSA